MKLSQLKNSIESGALLDSFKKAYVTDDFAKAQYDRYLKTAEAFAEVYGDGDREICLFSAPGRSEVCGNHTDHNHGCVLAAGISLDAVAVASKNDTNTVNIKSAGYKMDAARAGDEEMMKVFNEYLHEVALGVAGYYMVFRPEAIVLGGGVSAAGEIFLDGVRRALKEIQPRFDESGCRICLAMYRNEAGMRGAAALAKINLQGDGDLSVD